MIRHARILFPLLICLLPVWVEAADPVPAAAFTVRAKQTKDRIDALFRHRNDAPVRPAPNQNPFRVVGTAPVTTAVSSTPVPQTEESSTSDDLLLAQAVASLKIGGTTRRQEVIYVTINSEFYKTGDLITARVRGTNVLLRIRRISPISVTFGLKDVDGPPELIRSIP